MPVQATDACCGAAVPFQLSCRCWGGPSVELQRSTMIEPTDVTLTVLTSVLVAHKEATNCIVGLIARLIAALAQGPGEWFHRSFEGTLWHILGIFLAYSSHLQWGVVSYCKLQCSCNFCHVGSLAPQGTALWGWWGRCTNEFGMKCQHVRSCIANLRT